MDLLVFSFFTRFLFQLLYSPAHLNQVEVECSRRKAGKVFLFNISIAGELLKSGHNFLNKPVSTEQMLYQWCCLKSSAVFFFVIFCVSFCGGFLFYFIKRHLAMDHKSWTVGCSLAQCQQRKRWKYSHNPYWSQWKHFHYLLHLGNKIPSIRCFYINGLLKWV